MYLFISYLALNIGKTCPILFVLFFGKPIYFLAMMPIIIEAIIEIVLLL